MSAVGKSAKTALFIFGGVVLLAIVVGVFVYANLNSIAKNFAEKSASDALGVPVTIGDMDISLNDKKVVVSDIAVANPRGYKNKYALTIKKITVDGESFSKKLLVFSLIQVDGTAVNLEVNEKGANLGDLKQYSQKTVQSSKSKQPSDTKSDVSDIRIVVRKFALTGAKITPSVTLMGSDNLPPVKVQDVVVKNIGEKENGVTPEEAVAQIMGVVLDRFNGKANSAGFLEGMSLDNLNAIGISTGKVFQKNLKKSYKKEIEKFKKGFGGLKKIFE